MMNEGSQGKMSSHCIISFILNFRKCKPMVTKNRSLVSWGLEQKGGLTKRGQGEIQWVGKYSVFDYDSFKGCTAFLKLRIVHLKCMQCIVHKLYFNEVDFKHFRPFQFTPRIKAEAEKKCTTCSSIIYQLCVTWLGCLGKSLTFSVPIFLIKIRIISASQNYCENYILHKKCLGHGMYY